VALQKATSVMLLSQFASFGHSRRIKVYNAGINNSVYFRFSQSFDNFRKFPYLSDKRDV